LPVDLEPSHPKMGILVKEASEGAHVILTKKRSVQPLSPPGLEVD